MEKISKGIIFSDDIFRILKGKNALDFSYEEQGLIIPSQTQIEILREDFKKDASRIFNGLVKIFTEEEMEYFLNDSLTDVLGYPHCVIR